VNAGEVDAKRLCIDGRSAGGYTTMAALVFSDTFTAGATLFGLSDLTVFVTETHKFESRYLDSLIGSTDKEKKLYDRSPINFLDRLSCPVIVFQGLEDKVVPPNQARLIYEAVKAKGIPVALIEYEGEQHGFLKVSHTFSCFLLCLNCAQKGVVPMSHPLPRSCAFL
jgi:dipeptidyl aminopeptidase/acylaminoacyl peptidase